MRRAEWPFGEQADPGPQLARHRVNGRRFNRLVERERRENAGEPSRQHGFAGPRRPDHQEVVTARGGDFECAASEGLAVEVGEVEI